MQRGYSFYSHCAYRKANPKPQITSLCAHENTIVNDEGFYNLNVSNTKV